MNMHVLTLFPDMFHGVLQQSILHRAQEDKRVHVEVHQLREHADNKHKNVDDYPYGGGAGMVLQPQPVFAGVRSIESKSTAKRRRIVLMCPQGERFTQAKAEELSQEEELIFICGHYEGYDERIREQLVTDEISIGDYVLTGGELPAMVVMDSIIRLLPDVLGNESSAKEDSFQSGLLEHPHYTRPQEFEGLRVPDVLLSGHHERILAWREVKSVERTWERRPDLLDTAQLTDRQREWLQKKREK
ncbi:tRNA (guanosine(37)-N1)-methyltransferase TrmD [Bacillus fonticola]|uniref:tRNA (guanosine(37)-N1)-methyltransferase TrmD n=1 Tax=Bacillus fonticola TaxID=2728853 RepID=UPI001472D038|nr:tRNA (guanosine(37)-N1)-methyltransferase TrmD [Bacillus fonticola]